MKAKKTATAKRKVKPEDKKARKGKNRPATTKPSTLPDSAKEPLSRFDRHDPEWIEHLPKGTWRDRT